MPDKSENLPPGIDPLLAKLHRDVEKVCNAISRLRQELEEREAWDERAEAISKSAAEITTLLAAVNESTAGVAVMAKDQIKDLREATDRCVSNSSNLSESLAAQHETLEELREITAMLIAWRANGYKTEGMYDTDSDSEDAEAESEDDGGRGEGEA